MHKESLWRPMFAPNWRALVATMYAVADEIESVGRTGTFDMSRLVTICTSIIGVSHGLELRQVKGNQKELIEHCLSRSRAAGAAPPSNYRRLAW